MNLGNCECLILVEFLTLQKALKSSSFRAEVTAVWKKLLHYIVLCGWHGAFPIDTWLASVVEAGGGARQA